MTTPKITDGSVIDLMHQFTKEAREAKAAKPAGDGSEPTSFSALDSEDAGTSPVARPSLEDGHSGGERSSENKSDNATYTPSNVEDSGSKNTDGDSEHASDSIGTQSLEAGDSHKQPSQETLSPPKKHDGSPESPDMNPPAQQGSFSEKYSQLNNLGNKIGAGVELLIKNSAAVPGAAPVAAPAAAPAQAPVQQEGEDPMVSAYKQAAANYPDDEEAGYVAAAQLAQELGMLGDEPSQGQEKAASNEDLDVAYFQVVDGLRKKAHTAAEVYANYMQGFLASQQVGAAAMNKAAMPGEDDYAGGGGGELPPEAMAAMMGGGGEEMGGGGGELPPEMMGGGGEEGGGEMGMGGMGGEMGGEGDADSVIEALKAMGVDEKMIMELAQQAGEGEMGGEEVAMGGEEGLPPELMGGEGGGEEASPEAMAAMMGGGGEEMGGGGELEEAAMAGKMASHQRKAASQPVTQAQLRTAVGTLLKG